MNKKRLSVVMAGAMLASSVAPVLAADAAKSEISAAELGLLVQKLRNQIESKKFSEGTAEATRRNGLLAGKSVYYVTLNGKTTTETTAVNGATSSSDLQAKLQALVATLNVGDKVEIRSYGFVEEEKDGKTNVYAQNYKKEYAASDINTNLATEIADSDNALTSHPLIKSATYDELTGKITIVFEDSLKLKDVVLGEGSKILDFTKYFNADGQISDIPGTDVDITANFKGFPEAATADLDLVPIANELVETVEITSGGNVYKTEDLYDGLMLTTEGHELLSLVKAAGSKESDVLVYDLNSKTPTTDISSSLTLTKNDAGEYKVKLTIANAFDGAAGPYTFYVTGTDKENLETVLSWLNKGHAKVDILAGSDRYETAVQIAKEQASLDKIGTNSNHKTGDIVLVNGDSLVDGLSAAPLAAKIAQDKTSKVPVLLTAKNELPRVTKDYLVELLEEAEIGGLNNVNIHIVGGDGVVSKGLERELKKLGFSVERYGGEDREATSMAVAEEIAGSTALTDAFVVGATGEADAMSIAGYAASKKAPIIVSNFDGLSEETMYELKGVKTTVVGGDNAVSEADYKELATYTGANKIRRISGEDRKATNAAVINEFYSAGINGAKSVIVAKDDVLIDALTAANLASVQNAPIVLATKELSKAQINALELKAKSADNVYQVGHGVDPTNVVKVVAQRLGLAK